jgi:hypothetical protein
MSSFKNELFGVVLVLLCVPALAINKCTGADGRTVFQDTPCQGKGEILDVKPAAGRALPASTAGAEATSGGRSTTEAQRIEAQVLFSQKERRRRDLETIETLQAAGALDTHRRGCEQEQKSLSSEQYKYRQNLYGKTHAAQVASEMAAASARCDLKDRALKEQLEALKSECIALSGCK